MANSWIQSKIQTLEQPKINWLYFGWNITFIVFAQPRRRIQWEIGGTPISHWSLGHKIWYIGAWPGARVVNHFLSSQTDYYKIEIGDRLLQNTLRFMHKMAWKIEGTEYSVNLTLTAYFTPSHIVNILKRGSQYKRSEHKPLQ